MDDISKLSNAELSKQLKSHDLPSGPITKTTRPLFERKLRKHLAGSNSDETSESKDGSQSVGDSSHITASANGDIKSGVVDTQVGLGKNETSGSETSKQFYSIQLPKDVQGEGVVLTDRTTALQQLKKLPGSRLKVFTSREDAVCFSKQPESSGVTVCPKPSGSEVKVSSTPMVPAKLKRAIEAGDLETVRSLIWSNPRYLIASGDTPTIIQVGCHYNALHVAAVKNQPAICRLVLEALEDVRYVKMLYPDESSATDLQCINFLLDLYLNTPDKGNCETPLHFACKFGHIDVVDVLASHPRTDKSVVNRDGHTPKDVICERVQRAGAEVRERIAQSLEDHYFVPLLRADDDSKTPLIGAPWTPSDSHHKSPLVVPSSPMDSPVSVKAYAGPMTPAKAKEFQKWWRYRKSAGRSTTECSEFQEIKRSDYEKGLERIGRMMAHDMGISWSEYWDFLHCFTDLSTTDGLHRLNTYLQQLTESEHDLAAQNHALLQVERQMDSLSLGHSPEGAPAQGVQDSRGVLRCWGTPPGVRGSEGGDGEQRDGRVDGTREKESESGVLVSGGAEVGSESVVTTNGARSDGSENESKSENIAASKGDGDVSSETTLTLGGDEGESAGRDVETESRNIETDMTSSNDDNCQQCEPQRQSQDVSTEETTSCDTPVSSQGDVNATLSVTITDTVTSCQTPGADSKSHDQSCTDRLAPGGSTIGDQNATVAIDGDIVQITDVIRETPQDVSKDTVQQNVMTPGGSTCTTGDSSPEGHMNVDLSPRADESLDTTLDATCVSRVCESTTRAHDRGDGIDNDVVYNSHSSTVDGGDAQRTKSHDTTTDKPASLVSHPTSRATAGTNVAVTDDTQVSPDGPDIDLKDRDMTQPRDSASGSDDACSVCSSVSSYHTARDNVDFDYANLDDVFVPSQSLSPSRLPPIFILGNTPSKKDLDVLRAIENISVSPDDHPHVTQWRHLVLSYSEEARKTWSTPMRQRKQLGSHVTPTLDSTPRGISSPPYTDHVTTSGSSDSSQSDADTSLQHQDMRHVRANLMSSFSSF